MSSSLLNIELSIDTNLLLQKNYKQQSSSTSIDYKCRQGKLFSIKWRISKSFAAKATHDPTTAECWIVNDSTGTQLWNMGCQVLLHKSSF